MKFLFSVLLSSIFLLFLNDNQLYTLSMGSPQNCELAASICAINTDKVTNDAKQVYCQLEKLGEKNLKITILKQQLSDKFYFNFLATGYMKFELDYTLDSQVVSDLSLSNIIIKTGKYLVVETATSYEMEVNLK